MPETTLAGALREKVAVSLRLRVYKVCLIGEAVFADLLERGLA
jgi:hypothetical protein